MFWLYLILGILIGLALIITLIGVYSPKSHKVARTLRLKQSPEQVWAAVSDFAAQEAWRPQIKKVERLADRQGREVWREQWKRGSPITLETELAEPPRRLVRRIADEHGPFSGTWEFLIAPAEGGSRLTLTECGELPNPFIRGLARLFMKPAMFVEMFLKDLAAKFGEPANIE